MCRENRIAMQIYSLNSQAPEDPETIALNHKPPHHREKGDLLHNAHVIMDGFVLGLLAKRYTANRPFRSKKVKKGGQQVRCSSATIVQMRFLLLTLEMLKQPQNLYNSYWWTSPCQQSSRVEYYWSTLKKDCIEFVKMYNKCRRFDTLGALTFDHVTMPIPVGKVKFLIVTVDYFTKWIEAELIKTIIVERLGIKNHSLQSNTHKQISKQQSSFEWAMENVGRSQGAMGGGVTASIVVVSYNIALNNIRNALPTNIWCESSDFGGYKGTISTSYLFQTS
ncbi:hypothetical protein CR513_23544, partial [Mucuna pruriens]